MAVNAQFDKANRNPQRRFSYTTKTGRKVDCTITGLKYWVEPEVTDGRLLYKAFAEVTVDRRSGTFHDTGSTCRAEMDLDVSLVGKSIEEKDKPTKYEAHFSSASLQPDHKENFRGAKPLGTALPLERAKNPKDGFSLKSRAALSFFLPDPDGMTKPTENNWDTYREKVPFAEVEMTVKGSVSGDTATVKVDTQFDGGLNASFPVSKPQPNTYKWKAVPAANKQNAGGD